MGWKAVRTLFLTFTLSLFTYTLFTHNNSLPALHPSVSASFHSIINHFLSTYIIFIHINSLPALFPFVSTSLSLQSTIHSLFLHLNQHCILLSVLLSRCSPPTDRDEHQNPVLNGVCISMSSNASNLQPGFMQEWLLSL